MTYETRSVCPLQRCVCRKGTASGSVTSQISWTARTDSFYASVNCFIYFPLTETFLITSGPFPWLKILEL